MATRERTVSTLALNELSVHSVAQGRKNLQNLSSDDQSESGALAEGMEGIGLFRALVKLSRSFKYMTHTGASFSS